MSRLSIQLQLLEVDFCEFIMILFVFQLSFVAEKVEQVDGKVQTRKLSKEEEIKLVKSAKLKCKLCDMWFPSKRIYRSHIVLKHQASELEFFCSKKPKVMKITQESFSLNRNLYGSFASTLYSVPNPNKQIRTTNTRLVPLRIYFWRY